MRFDGDWSDIDREILKQMDLKGGSEVPEQSQRLSVFDRLSGVL
jgi:hypothetical protein